VNFSAITFLLIKAFPTFSATLSIVSKAPLG